MSKRQSLTIGGSIDIGEKLDIGEVFARGIIDRNLEDWATRAIQDGATEAEVLRFITEWRAECYRDLHLQMVKVYDAIVDATENDRSAVRH